MGPLLCRQQAGVSCCFGFWLWTVLLGGGSVASINRRMSARKYLASQPAACP